MRKVFSLTPVLVVQDQQDKPSKRSEPTKKAQMIEPMLRKLPQQRAVQQTTAAYLRTAKAETSEVDNKRPNPLRSQPNNHAQGNHDSRQQDLYKQQIQDALREASPDSRIESGTAQQQSQKRPTSRMAPRQQRPSSPALQDLTDR